jgi:ABC-type lipoprotein release transport system permease subunit
MIGRGKLLTTQTRSERQTFYFRRSILADFASLAGFCFLSHVQFASNSFQRQLTHTYLKLEGRVGVNYDFGPFPNRHQHTAIILMSTGGNSPSVRIVNRADCIRKREMRAMRPVDAVNPIHNPRSHIDLSTCILAAVSPANGYCPLADNG